MKPSIILFFVLRQDTELVAVMEIKSTQAADFLNIRKRPLDPIDLDLLRWVGKSVKPYGIRVLADTLRYSVVGIILSELIEPLRSLPALSDNRPILAIRVKAHTVAHLRHNAVKVFQRVGLCNGFINCLPCNIISCGVSLFFRLVKSIGLFLAAWVFNDGQGILTAKLIGTLTEQPQVCFVIVVMFPVRERYGVHDKVVMQAVSIKVGGNNDLKSVAPHSLGKSDPDLVRLLWRDLARLEALEAVITDNLAPVVPLGFGNHHFISCGSRVAVYARDKETLFGLILIGGVLHYIDHRL